MKTNEVMTYCFYYGLLLSAIFWKLGKHFAITAKWENRAKFGFWFGYLSLWYSM